MTESWWQREKSDDVMWGEPIPARTDSAMPPGSPENPDPPPATPRGHVAERVSGKKRVLRVSTGVATVALVGAILVNATTSDGETSRAPKPGSSAQEVLPISEKGDLFPAAGGDRDSREPIKPDLPVMTGVALFSKVVGSGQTGVLIEMTIENNTDATIMLMSSMFKADGRSGMVGEGTLAPGSRTLGTGEVVTGTVEFAADGLPAQIVLLAIDGRAIAICSVSKRDSP